MKFKDITKMPTKHNVGMKGFNIPTTSKMYNADEIDNMEIPEATVEDIAKVVIDYAKDRNIWIDIDLAISLSKKLVIFKRKNEIS